MSDLPMTDAELGEDRSQYLTFKLSGEEYGLPILKVQEIKGSATVTPIPNTPAFIKGAMNLRGAVIPVIDLRDRFNIATADEKVSVTIVVNLAERVVGLVVDAVSDVLTIVDDEIAPPPALGGGVDVAFLTGVARSGEKLVLLLDIDCLLGEDAARLPAA